MAGQPDRPARLDRLGERRQPTAVLDEIIDGPDDSPLTFGEPVADLVERPEFDPRVVQRVAEPVVKPGVLAEAVLEDDRCGPGAGRCQAL